MNHICRVLKSALKIEWKKKKNYFPNTRPKDSNISKFHGLTKKNALGLGGLMLVGSHVLGKKNEFKLSDIGRVVDE